MKISKKRLTLNDSEILFKNDLVSYFRKLNLNSIKKLIYSLDPIIKINKNSVINDLNYRNQLIYNSNNLKIYNDSKCTNLSNAIYKNNLINSSKKILILGGKFKMQDKHIKFNVSNTLVLIFGHNTNIFLNHLNFINSNFYKFVNLNQLIIFLKLILKLYQYNYVLFSPGGESFDSYQNYIERGKHFNHLIKKRLL